MLGQLAVGGGIEILHSAMLLEETLETMGKVLYP